MSPQLANRVSNTARSYRAAEKSWRHLMLAGARTPAEKKRIRVEAVLRRRSEWPTEDHIAEACLRGRLAEPDTARDWAPLSDEERAELSLPGMWPGSERPDEDFSTPCAYTLDHDLIWAARTAAWRISAPWISAILSAGLGNLRTLTADQRAVRAELGANVLTFGALVRQGISNHWPAASADESQSKSLILSDQ